MLKDFRFAVFDVDGTLLDTKKFYRWMLKRVLERESIRALKENNHSLFGIRKKTIAPILYLFFERLDRRPRLFNRVPEVLEVLFEKQIKMFATTKSKSENIKKKLNQTGILGFFEMLAGREIPKSKHIPLFAKHANKSLRDFCSQAFYVGDEPEDMIIGARYGLHRIGITNTLSSEMLKEAGAQEVIDKLSYLKRYLKI